MSSFSLRGERKARPRSAKRGPRSAARFGLTFLFLATLEGAQRAWAADGPSSSSPRFELERDRNSLAVRGVRSEDGGELRFWSCPERGACAETEPVVRVAIPETLRALPFQRKSLKVDGFPLLDLALETDQSVFHVLVAPAARSASPAPPRVLFQGLLRDGETLRSLDAGRLVLAREVRACEDPRGRELSVNVRRLDLTRGEFVRARVSVLDPGELAQAERVSPSAAAPALPHAIEPRVGSTAEATSWTIGRAAGQIPWATLAFQAQGTAHLSIALEAGPDADLFLVRPDRVVQVHVERSETPRAVALPLRPDDSSSVAENSSEESCFLLTTGPSGAPVRAVSLRRNDRPFGSPESWARGLSGPDAKIYQSALRTDLAAAASAIDAEFLGLDSAGRAYALEILSETPGEFALAPLVNAAALGATVERQRATKELELYRHEIVYGRAEEAFSSARGPRAAGYASVMAHFGPERALATIAARLAEPRPRSAKNPKARDEERAVREELRAALRTAVLRATNLEELEALLLSQELARDARRELLRAYGPRRGALGFSLAPHIAELSRGFAGEYVLLELALASFGDLEPEVSRRLVERLAASSDPSWKPVELRAYQARLLELLTDQELPNETRARFFTAAIASLGSRSRVVRQSALSFLRESKFHATPTQAERVLELADRDEWLEVRASAWLTYGALAASLGEAERKAREEAIAKRLKPNRAEPIVARALVRALAKSGGSYARAELSKVLAQKGLAEVRADAADALGRLCERSAIAELTKHALVLGSPTSEDDVTIGLASVRALARLSPADRDRRLAPLMEKKVPGPIRGQVTMILESTPASCAPQK